jgi:hypothetical protein
VYDQYGQNESGIAPPAIDVNQVRTQNMLRNASDMQAEQLGAQLKVRVINYSGHKLPTGYPEGRRMWINVQFYDAAYKLLAERGGYDFAIATLSAGDTKVYDAKFGIDESIATATGLPPGQTSHLVLNNVILHDNRIPPIGFSNATFSAVRAAPVNYTYADGQYWDDTLYTIPTGAEHAVVTLYYQTTSKEYIEFLRDTNVTNSAGQNAYDLWNGRGMSAPVDMDMIQLPLAALHAGDVNHDGVVNMADC